MAHRFGAMPIPAAAPAANETLTDPGLDVLVDYFATVLTNYLSTAWSSVAPAETLIRKKFTHDPADSFVTHDLPALYLWREKDAPSRVADDLEQTQGHLMLMWVYPPTGDIEKVARRSSFINGFAKTIHRAVFKERDPSWIHADDVTSADPAAAMYGSDVLDKAGLDWWQFEGARRDFLTVETETEKFMFPVLMAEINVRESEESDPTVTNREPTAIEFTINEEGVLAQHEIEPDP